MASSIFGIAVSGLAAAQAGLQTTGHNISNVNTPGASRQSVVQATNIPQYSGAGFFGQGVHVTDVQRNYDVFLQAQSWSAQSSSSQMSAYSAQINQLDSLLGDTATGLSASLNAFFASVQDVASRPSDVAARQSMLAQAQAMANRFRDIDAQLDSQRADVSNRLGSTISQLNSIAGQIADLNRRIVALNSAGTGQQPNDLLDQRDQLVTDLSKIVNTQVIRTDDGSYNVLVGNGQPLVMGDGAAKLAAVPGDPDPDQVQITLQGAGGTVRLRSSDLSGGQLGGLLDYRDSVLTPAQNALGRIAVALSAAFNAQNRLGQDRNGNIGGDVFAAGAPVALPAAANPGNASLSVSVANATALTASDYDLRYDGANFTLRRNSDGNVTTFATLPQTVDGVSINLSSGSFAPGDYFLIEPTRAGAGGMSVRINDASQIAAALPVQAQAALANTGSTSVASLSVNGPPPVNTNLQQPVTITFTSPTTFDVTGTGTGNPTSVTFTPGGAISYNGWTLQLTGAPAAGDSFTVGANTGGSGDNRNALALAALQNSVLVGGNATVGDAYAQIVSDVGNKAQDARISGAAQAAVLTSVEQARQSVSGVNLDEEAANLMRYQQAYQASGKVLSIASTLFDTILHLGE